MIFLIGDIMKPHIFIDGEHGTTGLQIRERLAGRRDLEVISLAHEDRHDVEKRKDMLSNCDVAILCLPDDAAREAVSIVDANINSNCRIIDTSTAHRTHADWTFGFAELNAGQTSLIKKSNRVSNPGCYSTGAIALIKPLIDAAIMATNFPLTINAVSGYTGGGKQLIAQMEDPSHENHIDTSYHLYALSLGHKHVPEIMSRSGLEKRPIFTPSVGRFAQGMLVSIPLHLDQLNGNISKRDIYAALKAHYADHKVVEVIDASNEPAQIRPEDMAGSNTMKLYVLGDEATGHVNLVAHLDNLGKGASGAAVQNLDLMLSA